MSYRSYLRQKFARSLREAFVDWMKREWTRIRTGETAAF